MQTNICQAHKQNNVVRESKLSLILVNLKQQILTPPEKNVDGYKIRQKKIKLSHIGLKSAHRSEGYGNDRQ